ncbi:hypothetical protein G1H11_20415 [Phytoactinopolyspora alkaliphila]|uniref:Uncharacterized protein n=1 Tax=Phytoactinopolyspora alkaliphila TaxID=1783498 RepID=A0A6N9YRU7_9ACTN|nr:hypothetical protein [Phytoactinopolyspora alkaliphila]NED97667.1 hypothetical protein [Phytoactinopolyspora alkaliphila]
MPVLPPGLFRRWVHMQEEDTEDIRVYRPAEYPLPPARSRDGIEFRPDGTFVRWALGPVDAPVASDEQTWSGDSEDTLRLLGPDGGTDAVLRIADLTDDVLRLRPIQG